MITSEKTSEKTTFWACVERCIQTVKMLHPPAGRSSYYAEQWTNSNIYLGNGTRLLKLSRTAYIAWHNCWSLRVILVFVPVYTLIKTKLRFILWMCRQVHSRSSELNIRNKKSLIMSAKIICTHVGWTFGVFVVSSSSSSSSSSSDKIVQCVMEFLNNMKRLAVSLRRLCFLLFQIMIEGRITVACDMWTWWQ